jgi:hypothetical protein
MPAVSQLPTPVQNVSQADVLIVEQVAGSGSNAGTAVVCQAPIASIVALVPTTAQGILALPTGTNAPTTADSVVMVQSGSADLVPYATAIDGQTIGQLAAAGAASVNDTFPVSQGGSSLVSQTFANLSSFVRSQIPSYGLPTVELSTSGAAVAIDATYNGKLIIVSAANVTLTPSFMGNGFFADIITVGTGTVILGSGWISSNGLTTIASNKHAMLIGATYSGSGGGTISFVDMGSSSSGSGVTAPGAPTVTAVGTITGSSIVVNWTAPTTGGTPTSYSVNWRTTSGPGAWQSSPVVVTYPSTSATITGLAGSTQYDVEVSATNAGGSSSQAVSTAYATTASGYTTPGLPTNVAFSAVGSSGFTVTWSAPSGSTVTGYTVQYRITGTQTWTQQSTTTTSATLSGLQASTSYDVQVQSVNGTATSAFTTTITNSTSAASSGQFNSAGYLLSSGVNGGVPVGPYSIAVNGPSAPGAPNIAFNVNDNSASADGSHTTPASVYFAWSTSNTVSPTGGIAASNMYGGSIFNLSGHNVWWVYGSTPNTPGTYYLWALAYNGGGTLVAAFVNSGAVTVTA